MVEDLSEQEDIAAAFLIAVLKGIYNGPKEFENTVNEETYVLALNLVRSFATQADATTVNVDKLKTARVYRTSQDPGEGLGAPPPYCVGSPVTGVIYCFSQGSWD